MISIAWSAINQAYLVLWNSEVLAIKQSRADATDWLEEHNLSTKVVVGRGQCPT